jgi:hypothetical protein
MKRIAVLDPATVLPSDASQCNVGRQRGQACGLCLVLMKWYPGYMSAPHFYRTDRQCVVVSGVLAETPEPGAWFATKAVVS